MPARSRSRRRRRQRAILAASAMGGVFLIIASSCSPFDAAGHGSDDAATAANQNEASSSSVDGGQSGSSTSDTGFVPPLTHDASAGTDAEGIPPTTPDSGLTCYDFTTGSQGFAVDGDTELKTKGFVLTVGPAKEGRVFRTFSLVDGGTIHKTSLAFHITAASLGNFDLGSYLDYFAQYLGPNTGFDKNPAMEIEARKGGFDVDVWYEPNKFDPTQHTYPIAQPLSITDVRIDTDWSTGTSLMTLGPNGAVLVGAPPTTSSHTAFTIAVGGSAVGATSTITMTVVSICVGLSN